MYLDLDKKERNKIAAVDCNGRMISYGKITDYINNFHNMIKERCLVLILMKNDIFSFLNYLSCIENRIVPILIGEKTDFEYISILVDRYHPAYIIGKKEDVTRFNKSGIVEMTYQGYVVSEGGRDGMTERNETYCLLKTGLVPFQMHDDLSLLLTTSGSTGSPKLVRHSYRNLEYQAEKIAAFFEMDGTERPLVHLPIMYTYGLSIVNSYLYAGACVLLTDISLTNKKFWDFFKLYKSTSITGVPYTFETLKRIPFFTMDLPSLRMISQGGGKLEAGMMREYVEYIEKKGGKYYATYGQTEGSARMTFLPPAQAVRKCGSIGKAAGKDKIYLKDTNGNIIDCPGKVGELYFEGENVTLGYADSGDDLKKGDERNGVLATGDMAYFDDEGYYYITGRKKRFLKLYGYRVSLDECESMIRSRFSIDCACTGDDNILYICLTDSDYASDIKNFLLEKTSLYPSAVVTKVLETIPKNEAGKILYAKLKEML